MKQDDIVARAVLRDPPDVKALAKALVELAIQMERQRQKKAQAHPRPATSPEPSDLVK